MPRICLMVVLFALAVARVASADEFHDAYNRGLAAFKARHYSDARAEFSHAYDLRPEPIILFSIAQSYRLEGEIDDSLAYYRRFLGESKIAEDVRAEAARYVAELEVAARERDAKRNADAPKESDGKPVDVPSPSMDRARLEPPPAALPPALPAAHRFGLWQRVPTASWIAAGTAGIAAGTATVLGVLGIEAQNNLQHNPMATAADADGVRHYQTAINASWSVAAVAAVTSAVIFGFAPRRELRVQVVLAPTLNAGWAALVGGKF